MSEFSTFELSWKKLDPEAKWGLKAKKFTAVNSGFAFFLGVIFTVIFYAALLPFYWMNKYQMINMFFHGGPEHRSTIPYYTMLLSFWCLAFLLLKLKKIKVQRKALAIKLVPATDDYVITPANAHDILMQMGNKINRVENFLVLWRVQRALSNLKNIGRVSDVSSLLSDLAKDDASFAENSYTLPRGLIWAIPVIGFIGTVLGLSQAVGGFGQVIAGGADLDALKNALGGVTGGLATAFETTLIALVAALIIQLIMTFVMQKEEEFLDDCATYCHQNITSHLKLIGVEENSNAAGIASTAVQNAVPIPANTNVQPAVENNGIPLVKPE